MALISNTALRQLSAAAHVRRRSALAGTQIPGVQRRLV
jgi:hypothetical protein